MLDESIEVLSTTTEHIFPRVRVMISSRYGDKPEMSSYLPSQLATPNEFRGIIYQIEVRDDCAPSLRSELGISHFVGIRLGKSRGEWIPGSGVFNAEVQTTVEELPSLIHDIALDIAMFHSWTPNSPVSDVKLRQAFSARKADFAFARRLEDHYGGVLNPQIQYFSIASHCRRADRFLYERYEELWQLLMSDDSLMNPGSSIELVGGIESIAHILKFNHRDSGMLSLMQIAADVQELKPGVYLLATAGRKPKGIRHKIRSGNLLGGATWHKKLWKVIPFTTLNQYARYAALGYITLFKFRVP